MSAVYHDLQVLHFKVACQALSFKDKYVTGPLWRIMVKEKQVQICQSSIKKCTHFLMTAF